MLESNDYYEVLDYKVEGEAGSEHCLQSWRVKLKKKKLVARGESTSSRPGWFQSQYLNIYIGHTTIPAEDGDGRIPVSECGVTLTDENFTYEPLYAYKSSASMSFEELMFTVGAL